jgi:hypothetical protein
MLLCVLRDLNALDVKMEGTVHALIRIPLQILQCRQRNPRPVQRKSHLPKMPQRQARETPQHFLDHRLLRQHTPMRLRPAKLLSRPLPFRHVRLGLGVQASACLMYLGFRISDCRLGRNQRQFPNPQSAIPNPQLFNPNPPPVSSSEFLPN